MQHHVRVTSEFTVDMTDGFSAADVADAVRATLSGMALEVKFNREMIQRHARNSGWPAYATDEVIINHISKEEIADGIAVHAKVEVW